MYFSYFTDNFLCTWSFEKSQRIFLVYALYYRMKQDALNLGEDRNIFSLLHLLLKKLFLLIKPINLSKNKIDIIIRYSKPINLRIYQTIFYFKLKHVNEHRYINGHRLTGSLLLSSSYYNCQESNDKNESKLYKC